MGRPEPCVLFAQTFVHPQLDEFVDEVLFSEPVVISACEFLEQSASSGCSAVQLVGATSPPSFAMEVFVQCEGETRFRRLCQPFLYSHSSSNVLDVEAVVTNHLVIRGSYRSLSLVIYGNTAEDLGQFNIEVDLDNSLVNTVSSVEGNIEDLPPALRPTTETLLENLSPLKTLSLRAHQVDTPIEIKRFLQLTLKILGSQNVGLVTNRLLSSILSVASVYAMPCLHSITTIHKQLGLDKLIFDDKVHNVISEAIKELFEMHKDLNYEEGKELVECSIEGVCTASDIDSDGTEQLVNALIRYKYDYSICSDRNPGLSKKENVILWLSVALVLCSARESCFHFVNYGGMELLGYAYLQNSTALKLMLLGVIEQATRHSVGCEGFLGWWPRKDESVPSSISNGYNQLLKLLIKCQRHDVASLSTYVLHRIRFYEVACRYEHAVLSILESHLSIGSQDQSDTLDMLANAKFQIKTLLKLINSSGPIEDPSPVACASRSLLGDGQMSYESTSGLIPLSKCCHPNKDVDIHLLSLLKERGFLPLSAALLSFSALRTVKGGMLDNLLDIVSYLEAIVLSLLSCRSGLVFLACNLEQSTTLVHALRGSDKWEKENSISLRYASALISKGFFLYPHEIALIMEMHLKAINAVDLLVTSNQNSEDFLWILWKLCGLSRSDGGREALLNLVHFPEAVSALMATLHSAKELDPSSLSTVASPLNHAVFHSAAEIFEIIVSDSTPSSLSSWIEHVKDLHKLLLSSSHGSNKKDAPARLLDWIDAGLVYHKNGAIGLLRYAAVLASGGDAHMTSTNVLASDVMDIDNIIGDSSSASEGNLIDSILGKRITEKDFPGVFLRDSSVVQLTTAFRILAFISDNSTVAAALYDEGAVMVVHAVLINCRLLLERSSNVYDYLVDESTECGSTSDILLERNREQSLIDLLIPSLVLLINLLQKLQEAKEQHRNTKLINSLVQLHREVSPKLAASASDLSYSCPKIALGLGAVCHLLVSALACWSIYGWTPGLFHFLFDNLNSTSVVALGPKETSSLLLLLHDLFPDERAWLWKDGMPTLATLRTSAVRTLLGPQKEEEVNWYLQPGHSEKLLGQMAPQLGKISQIILHCCVSTLIVMQDMLRVFITRITYLSTDTASVLIRPIVLKIHDHLSDPSTLSEVDVYKVHNMLLFISLLLEHPHAKNVISKAGVVQMLLEVLQKCLDAANSDPKVFLQNRAVSGKMTSTVSWCTPVFKSISIISDSQTHGHISSAPERHIPEAFTAVECTFVLTQLLTFFKILPVEKELLACLSAFKEIGRSAQGKSSLHSIFLQIQSADEDYESESCCANVIYNMKTYAWRDYPPLAYCWRLLLNSISSQNIPLVLSVEAIGTLCLGSLNFCMDAESQMKPDLDDDLQGIDIVFDAEVCEPDDDKLPFPQPDDPLQQNSPPRSIVEETASEETRQSSRVMSYTEENTQSEFSSRMSVFRPEVGLTREPSISSERKFNDQPEELRSSVVKTSTSSLKPAVDSHSPTEMFSRTNVKPNHANVPQKYYDKKSQLGQPNVPPMMPIAIASPVAAQQDYKSMRTSSSASLTSSPMPDLKYRTSTSSSIRPFPPLPPTPPPFGVNPSSLSLLKPSTSHSPGYNQNNEVQHASASDGAHLSNPSASGPLLTPFSPPPSLAPHLIFSRPYGSNSPVLPHHADNLHSIGQLQPLQVPQMPRHPPSQQLRPFVQSDQGVSLLQQSRMHMQMQQQQPLPQMMLQQQPQLSPAPPPHPPVYYNTNNIQQQHESISHPLTQHQQQQHRQHDLLPQGLHQHGDSASQQQDSGMSLQDFFKSPEAIQSLLSDRDKLCQLLEQHPKLMQMLQDRLGQL
ncbi:unnamed protein product [Cuscuta campestris]|uniref:Virilizer N-terminal domain-containing protein n=1 Tax=Cuscuta campestris TaxID=132261 RepID=A0A484MEN4_9ASTE|nr:unnamed protein product [Cuscuta campestris]